MDYVGREDINASKDVFITFPHLALTHDGTLAAIDEKPEDTHCTAGTL